MQIKVENLSFSYNKKDNVLNNLNYCFESNNCYLLKGANGSGKTTFSKLLCGLLKTQENSIFIDGQDIKKHTIATLAQKIGYLYQNPDLHFFCETVQNELAFAFIINDNYDDEIKQKIENLLGEFELTALKDNFPLLLSGGEKQRLALATIFIRDINFLILDEPTSAIDNQGKLFLAHCINSFVENGGGALIITHDEEFEKMLKCDKVLTLKEGGIYES